MDKYANTLFIIKFAAGIDLKVQKWGFFYSSKKFANGKLERTFQRGRWKANQRAPIHQISEGANQETGWMTRLPLHVREPASNEIATDWYLIEYSFENPVS